MAIDVLQFGKEAPPELRGAGTIQRATASRIIPVVGWQFTYS
jgi:hypothetical protein